MPHHVVTGLRDLGFMSDENPRAAEELALLRSKISSSL